MRTKVTISKHWNHPQIMTTVSVEGISLEMDMEDFKIALKQEMGSVFWTLKKDTFEKRLDEAIQRILSGIKEEAAKVVR